MRIVQLIDSLEAGGAERMAVTIANGLSAELSFSALVVTRKEGALKSSINKNVVYKYLYKKSTFDLKSILRFRTFLISNRIDLIHAHGSSYFYAFLIKIVLPKIKIFWHDHNGNRVNLKRSNNILQLISFFFSGVFTVNEELKNWAEKRLLCNTIYFVPNFAVINKNEIQTTFLKGEFGKRIICLANLRHPKNHITMLKSFLASNAKNNNWTLHLIGNDYNDTYSNELKQFVRENDLDNNVFFYGSCNDISLILKQGSIGVLASTYEGFPVTLLEYGISKLAVISTDVGYCKILIQDKITGLLFNPGEETRLVDLLNDLMNNISLVEKLSNNLHTFVLENFSESIVLKNLIQYYKRVL